MIKRVLPNHFIILVGLYLLSLSACSVSKVEPSQRVELVQPFDVKARKKSNYSKKVKLVRKNLYTEYLDRALKEASLTTFNGSILIAQGDETLVEKAFGFSDFEKKIALDSSSQFIIASLSKQISAAIILNQIDEGQLALSDTAGRIIKNSKNNILDKITIKQLLNHTSGFDGMKEPLEFVPGSKFAYSNKGYNLLGEIAEEVSGKSYDSLALELFKKCGMQASSTVTAYQKGNLVVGYDGRVEGKKKIIPKLLSRVASPKIGTPAGGVISTVRDLTQWNQCLHRGTAISKESYQQMVDSSSYRKRSIWGELNYGFGIQIKDTPKEYSHGGYVKGFPAMNLYYPETDVSILILSNISDDSEQFPFIFSFHKRLRRFAHTIESALLKTQKEL